MPQQHLFLIIPPDLPGSDVQRSQSAGIGVSQPRGRTRRLLPQRKPAGRMLPPMDILYGAAVAEQGGASVHLMDAGLERWTGTEAVRRIAERAAKATGSGGARIGILLSMPALLHDLAFAKAVKAARPNDAVFLFGSTIMTTLDHWVSEARGVDAIVYGELEEIVGRLLSAAPETWNRVPGLIDPNHYTPQNARDLFNESMVKSFDGWARVKKLADLPHPAWHLLPLERYSPTGRREDCGVYVQASRGCPIGCTMCPYMLHEGRAYRPNSPDRVVEEIKHLNDAYGITHVSFRDPNFGYDKRQMRELANKIIAAGVRLDAAAELSLEMTTPEDLDLLHQAGIRTILTGIETNDEACLQSIGQKIKINDLLAEKIAYCSKIGITIFGSFVVGAPEETWDSVRRTIEYAKQVDAQCAATIMTPFPGTPMFFRAIEEGLLEPRMRFEDWNSYTATMRTYALTCRDLTAARLWFRLETIIPYRLRQARKSGKAAKLLMTQVRLTPHYMARQAVRSYVAWRRLQPPAPVTPRVESGAQHAQQTRRALWMTR